MGKSIHDADDSLEQGCVNPESSSMGNEEDEMSGTDPALDWEGDDDGANPMNWPLKVRIFHTAVLALYCFLITVGSSIYTPAVLILEDRFHISREVALLGLSLFTFGLGLGPLTAAPLSEIYGRLPVYRGSLVLLLAFTAGAGYAQNIETLLICRFLAGAGGSAALAVAGGSTADLWSAEKDQKYQGRAAVSFVLSGFLGPTLGPCIGAYIIAEYDDDWRYSMWVILMIGAPAAIATLFLKETSKQQILLRRAKARHQPIRHRKTSTAFIKDLQMAMTRPVIMVFTEPLVACLSLYTGFAFAMVFSFLTSVPYVFISVYGFNYKKIGLVFVAMMIGCVLGVVSFVFLDMKVYQKAVIKGGGRCAKEYRLNGAIFGSILLPISLFWFAWGSDRNVHWIVPTIALVPFGCGILCIFLKISVTAYLVEVYLSATSASALAANGLLRYSFGAAFPLFTVQVYEAWGIHWAGSFFAFISLLLMPVPYIMFLFGNRLRGRSKFDAVRY